MPAYHGAPKPSVIVSFREPSTQIPKPSPLYKANSISSLLRPRFGGAPRIRQNWESQQASPS